MQSPSHSSVLVVRRSCPDADLIATVREEAARLDPDLPVYRTRPMSDVVGASPGIRVRRALATAFTEFALLAVVLGGVGLFGVLAHDVASRRAELALRIAIGADPAQILRATLWRSWSGREWSSESCSRHGPRGRSVAPFSPPIVSTS